MSTFFPIFAYEKSKRMFDKKNSSSKGNEYGFIAMNLFGSRFFSDETSMELLSELLLVLSSPKKIKANCDEIILEEMLPSIEIIPILKENDIQYKPDARINLKLFSIMPNAGKVAPDATHKEQYEKIKGILERNIDVSNQQYITDKEDISFILSNLYMGFQGIGGDRDWCAQSFIPISSKLLAIESIWKKTKAKRAGITDFNDDNGAIKFFEHTGHIFYCRGGEVLFLQIVAALSKSKEEIDKWLNDSGMDDVNIITTDPEVMRSQLILGLNYFMNIQCPQMIGTLADYIDSLDPLPSGGGGDSFINMGWINDDSWTDGFLFIQDLLHIFRNESDLIETLKLLEMACTMQLLRTMVNSVKRFYLSNNERCPFTTAVIVSPQEDDIQLKSISHYSLKEIQLGIREAIGLKAREMGLNITDKDLASVHSSYGDKLYIKNCKRLGLVIPYKGGNEHFVLNKALLSYLVTSGNTPESRVSLDTFLRQVKERYGFVFTFDEIEKFNAYYGKKNKIIKEQPEEWVSKMLEESGYLIKLSDAYSLVVNNYKERVF